VLPVIVAAQPYSDVLRIGDLVERELITGDLRDVDRHLRPRDGTRCRRQRQRRNDGLELHRDHAPGWAGPATMSSRRRAATRPLARAPCALPSRDTARADRIVPPGPAGIALRANPPKRWCNVPAAAAEPPDGCGAPTLPAHELLLQRRQFVLSARRSLRSDQHVVERI